MTLNGQPPRSTRPPIERAGRVFVPLRGVFEQLGASVVYDNGTINAQGPRPFGFAAHRLDASDASTDNQQTLDVAPFIIGASTYVPLRFVSQALGATVNCDSSTASSRIRWANGPAPAAPPRTR